MVEKKLFLETTTVSVQKTSSEVIQALVQAGARQIGQEYDGRQKPVGVKFTLEIAPCVIRCFVLPARVEPVLEILWKRIQHKWKYDKEQLREKAEMVAWRQVLAWVKAQLAMVQCGMVEAEEVFLPYMEHESGKTFYEMVKEQEMKALPAPAESDTINQQ